MSDNPYRHSTPPGWNAIVTAPRDGTEIEIQNNWGIAPWYGKFKWQEGRGWVKASDPDSGVSDGPHLSWRECEQGGNCIDPTNGAQDSMEYWQRACRQYGYTGSFSTPSEPKMSKRRSFFERLFT